MRKYYESAYYSYDSKEEMQEHRDKMVSDGWKSESFTNEDGSEICVEYEKDLD